jgi:FixJ family two-component response regulator
MASPAPTVCVVDDEPAVRRSLSRLLKSHGYEIRLFGTAGEFLESTRPDGDACVLLDLGLPDFSGLQVQERLSGPDGATMPIVFITGQGDIPSSVQAMKKGAVDFLPKPIEEKKLLAAIEAALTKDREREALRSRFALLTPREKEVFALVVTGKLNKQTAASLGTSEKTVKVHRARVMAKMGARSLPDLVRMATQLTS